MNNLSERVIYVMALLIMAGYFSLQWQHNGVQPHSKKYTLPDMPPLPVIADSKTLKILLTHNLLEQNRGQAIENRTEKEQQQQQTDKQWHLLATALSQYGVPIVIISAQGKTKTLHEGELLPDGSRLLKILKDGCMIETKEKNQVVYLFGKKNND